MRQKVKDLPGLINELKPRLRDYLEKTGTQFNPNGQFQCPNRENHSNNDLTPSCGFPPDAEGEVWNCFACGEKGDVFKAAHFLEGKPLSGAEWVTDSVEHIAKLLGVTYYYEELTEDEKVRYQAYEALKTTAWLANAGLFKSEVAKKYIRARGWTTETVKAFSLGYCNYDKLIQVLLKRDYSNEVLDEAKIIHEQLFNKRLLFPIKDTSGRVVGFAGRTLIEAEDAKKKGVQKYVNSDSSALYRKSNTLYNLDKVQGDTVWIVEGYADAVTLWQKGVTNVAALGGVAFTEEHVQTLLRKGIRTVILCLDTDQTGQDSEAKILGQVTRRHGLTVLVKERDECKDPDSCLQTHDFLLTSGTKSMCDYFMEKYKASGDKKDRDKALRSIILEPSKIDRDKLCKRIAKELGVRIESIFEEVDLIIVREGDKNIVNILDSAKERQQFEKQLETYEQAAWTRGELVGLKTGFPIFTQEMEGIQHMFYIIAGEEQTGKSAFVRALMMSLLKENPNEVFILYFSIDDSIPKTISRLLAAETGLEINAMENPKYKIQLNDAYTEEGRQDALSRREEAVKGLHRLTDSFIVKDESTVKDTQDMEKTIKTFKEVAGKRQLVVFVDSLHRMKVAKTFQKSVREKYMDISDVLKEWCTIYQIPIIATAELRKLNTGISGNRRPHMDDIKEAADFKFDGECVLMMYSDVKAHEREPNKADLRWELVKDSGDWLPVLEVFVAKNKGSSFQQKCLYYKFIPWCAKLIEATPDEQIYFRDKAFNS